MEKVFLSDVLKAIKKAYIWNDEISQQILEKEMMKLPSAEEIVRCKDCEYFIQGKIHGCCDIHCNGAGEPEVMKRDGFCSYGTKAEGKRRRILDCGLVVKE